MASILGVPDSYLPTMRAIPGELVRFSLDTGRFWSKWDFRRLTSQ